MGFGDIELAQDIRRRPHESVVHPVDFLFVFARETESS